MIRRSGLDWVIVRPSVLDDKSRRGAVRALFSGRTEVHGGTIARGAVADFVVDQIESVIFVEKTQLITW